MRIFQKFGILTKWKMSSRPLKERFEFEGKEVGQQMTKIKDQRENGK
jgi:hypothetical protein